MKKIISVLIITAMMLASLALTTPALASDDDIYDDSNNEITEDTAQNAPLPAPDKSEGADNIVLGTPDILGVREGLAAALERASALLVSDYTDETAQGLTLAIEQATSILEDENAEYAALLNATSSLESAIQALIAKKADVSELKLLYMMYKYSDTKGVYNQTELDAAMLAAEEALNNSSILISEANEVLLMLQSVSILEQITSAEDFMAMEAGGSYVLASSITLTEPFDEFKGYICGGGYSVTIINGGVFNVLDGATVVDFKIEGEASSDSSFGALASVARGEVKLIDVTNNATVTVNAQGDDAVASGMIAQGENADILFKNCINNAKIIGEISAGFYGKGVGDNKIHFYNCINKGNVLGGSIASGFVADMTEVAASYALLEYCAELGNISADLISSAFFGIGKSNVEIYGGVVGGMNRVDVSAELNESAVGGVVGYVDGECGVDIAACYFNIDLTANDNAALVICAAESVNVSLKSIYINGSVVTLGNNAYRVAFASTDRLIVDTVFANTELMTYADGEKIENVNAADSTPRFDISVFDENSVKDASYGTMAFVSAVTSGMDIEKKAESTIMFTKALKMFKTPEEAELEAKKNRVINAINTIKKFPGEYTDESFKLYIDDVNGIIDALNAITDISEIDELEIVEKIVLAESMLVTLLDAAKADALVLLSAKRENAGKVFTAKSYEAYLEAYDLIVEMINSAESIDAIRALNLPELKVAAEVKLVVDSHEDIDDSSDEDYRGDGENEAEGNEKNDNEQGIDESDKNSGCASSVGFSVLAIVGLIGVSFLCKERGVSLC